MESEEGINNGGECQQHPPPEQQQPPSGRNLDDFLEAGFQATKGHDVVPSGVRSPSYLRIGSDGNDDAAPTDNTIHPGAGAIGAPATEFYHDSASAKIPPSAFRRQWRYWCIILSLGVANSSDATEVLCISYMLADRVFQTKILGMNNDNNESSHGAGMLAATVFLGMLLGGLFVGTMSDWIGRKPMLVLGLVCNSVSGVLSALSPNVYLLSALRCVSGLGIGATVPPMVTLATELAPPSARGFCVTIAMSFWMVGSIYVALVALWCFGGEEGDSGSDGATGVGFVSGLPTWRVFALICAVPSAVGSVLVYRLVPESPRFLGLEGRSREAVDVANALVEKMSGGTPSPVLPLTIAELERTFPSSAIRDLEDRQRRDAGSTTTTLLTTPATGGGRIESALEFVRLAIMDFFHSVSKLYVPGLLRTTLALQLVWFALNFGSYGLLTWINIIFEKVNLENIYFNALLFALSNLPGNVFTALYMDRIGRSASLVGSVGCASASLVLFAISAQWTYPTGIVASACLFQGFTIAAWNTMDTMTSELFPTPVRSTGLGICTASGRIGAMIAQFVNGALMEKPVRLLLVASGTLLLGALTPVLLPGDGDMTGRPVSDDLRSGAVVGGGGNAGLLAVSGGDCSEAGNGSGNSNSNGTSHPLRRNDNVVRRPTTTTTNTNTSTTR